MNSQFPITVVEASQVVDSYSLSEEFAAPDEETTFNTSSTSNSSGVKHDNTVLVDPRCSSSLDEFAVPQLVAEETTQNTVDTPSSSSTSTKCDDLANMLDSCIELLSSSASQMESIEKATERAYMLTKRMMETPLPEPPMVEPDRTSAKRRRRTRYTPLPGIMENAVYLAPSPWPPTRRT